LGIGVGRRSQVALGGFAYGAVRRRIAPDDRNRPGAGAAGIGEGTEVEVIGDVARGRLIGRRRGGDLRFERTNVHRAANSSREPALIRGTGAHVAVVATIDRRAGGQQSDRLRRTAVIRQRAETGVGDTDLVAVDVVDQPAAATGADQVIGTGGIDAAGNV